MQNDINLIILLVIMLTRGRPQMQSVLFKTHAYTISAFNKRIKLHTRPVEAAAAGSLLLLAWLLC